MANYVKPLARDTSGEPMHTHPAPFPALATYQRENAVASSVISLTPNTTLVEIAPIG